MALFFGGPTGGPTLAQLGGPTDGPPAANFNQPRMATVGPPKKKGHHKVGPPKKKGHQLGHQLCHHSRFKIEYLSVGSPKNISI